MEPDGIWVRACVLPGKPYWLDGQGCQEPLENRPDKGEPRCGQGPEGGRSAGVLRRRGQGSAGNSVEEKTPKNRQETESGRDQTAENPPLATVNTHLTRGTESEPRTSLCVSEASLGRGKPRTRGDEDSAKEAEERSEEESRKPGRGCPNPVEGYRREESLEGQEESGLRPKGPTRAGNP